MVHTISELQIGYMNSKENKFSEKTKRDEILTKVQTFCKEKWPEVSKDDDNLKHY